MTSHRSRNDLIFGRRSSNFYNCTTQLKKEKEEEEGEEKRRTILAILVFPHEETYPLLRIDSCARTPRANKIFDLDL